MEPDELDVTQYSVAPFAGAWIEMPKCKNTIRELKVAPFAGAWIEIRKD